MSRRVGERISLAVGLASLGLAFWLALFGGFDVAISGIRIRATDPFDSVVLGIVALTVFALLRHPPAELGPWITRYVSDLFPRARSAWPILGILLVAAVVRVWGLTFGLPHPNCRPDEGAVASIAGGIYYGQWVPYTYSYPPFFMIIIAACMMLIRAFGWLVFRRSPAFLARVGIRVPTLNLGSPAATFNERIIARVLSAATGVATVWVLFRVTTRLCGRPAALVAAAFLALAFLHVRDSHFGVTDVPMTFMLLVAFERIGRVFESGSMRDVTVAAVLAGLATATKYNAVLLVVPAMWAIFCGAGFLPIKDRLTRVATFLVILTAVFLIVCPGALLRHDRFMADVLMESRHLAGGHRVDVGPGWIYHATTSLRHGLGLPLFISAIVGMALLLYRHPRKGVLVCLFPVAYYLLIGSGRTVFARYALPLFPFMCLTAGYAVMEVCGFLARALGRQHWTVRLACIGTIVILAPSAESVIRFDRLLAQDDSRLLARRWIETQVAPRTTIALLGAESTYVFLPEEIDVPYPRVDFTRDGVRPGVIVIPSSRVTGGADLEGLQPILEQEYDLKFAQDVEPDDPRNVYDRQDEFYLPIAGFHGIERPGPNLKIYVRRD